MLSGMREPPTTERQYHDQQVQQIQLASYSLQQLHQKATWHAVVLVHASGKASRWSGLSEQNRIVEQYEENRMQNIKPRHGKLAEDGWTSIRLLAG